MQVKTDFLRMLTADTDTVREYLDWNYKARTILEDVLRVCKTAGYDGPWLPEGIQNEVEELVEFWSECH